MQRSSSQGYRIDGIDTPQGQAILLRQQLTMPDLERAIALYRETSSLRVGTLIGISGDGVFFAERSGWAPDMTGAFKEPLGTIPWVQIHELLGNVPDGATGDWLDSQGRVQ